MYFQILFNIFPVIDDIVQTEHVTRRSLSKKHKNRQYLEDEASEEQFSEDGFKGPQRIRVVFGSGDFC